MLKLRRSSKIRSRLKKRQRMLSKSSWRKISSKKSNVGQSKSLYLPFKKNLQAGAATLQVLKVKALAQEILQKFLLKNRAKVLMNKEIFLYLKNFSKKTRLPLNKMEKT